jgi:hypothetical protein
MVDKQINCKWALYVAPYVGHKHEHVVMLGCVSCVKMWTKYEMRNENVRKVETAHLQFAAKYCKLICKWYSDLLLYAGRCVLTAH